MSRATGYTRHGHRIDGVPATIPPPETRARCGGAGLCSDCSADAVFQTTTKDTLHVIPSDYEVTFGVTHEEQQRVVKELTEALRFTVEYVGTATLPPIPGWSWYDAMAKYAPEVARKFVDQHQPIRPREDHQ